MQFSFDQPIIKTEGPADAPILVLSGVPDYSGAPLPDHAKSFFLDAMKRVGLAPHLFRFEPVLGVVPPGRKLETLGHDRRETWIEATRNRLATSTAKLFVPLGSLALEVLTGHKSIDKWQLSIIPATKIPRTPAVKVIGLLSPEQIFASYSDVPFFLFGASRIAEEWSDPRIKVKPRVFHTGPSLDQILRFCRRALTAEFNSIDIETAYGQITCVGIAISETEAMSIPVLPDNWTEADHFTIWREIAAVLAGPAKKVFQNFIYDCTYFSRYGLIVKNLWHDTMIAQKFLHPELPMGLDTIARIYTREPYWKDEGKDWKNVGDLNQFWIYNCKDCSITLEAAHAQHRDLIDRGLDRRFYNFLMPLARPVAEMCWRGLPVSLEVRAQLTAELTSEIKALEIELNNHASPFTAGKPLNARSPKQVKEFFKSKRYKIPISKGKESTDVTSLLKLQQKYSGDPSIGFLLQLSEKNKALSSYLKPVPYPDDRFRFSFNLHGAETGRFSCRKDPWDNGLNAQTIPSQFKRMFIAPPGWLFLECDLRQADARFVAWDAPEPTLIKFFEEGRDIHRFVAARPELFNCALDQVTKAQRQLGKKTGHAANYGMRGKTLAEQCLTEMNLVIAPERADQMLEGYHRTFPGVRMWQQKIRNEVNRTKKLSTPLGRERFFYGRLGDDLYRMAYAYRPQSTVADVTNEMILFVDRHRNPELLHHALQVHDSVVFLVHESYLDQAITMLKATDEWNPKIPLSGGVLQIPIEAKFGRSWGTMQEIEL